MGFFSRFENKMEDAVEGTANKLAKSPISPVQISKQCEKCMMRNKIVGAGKQYAPTLYTVLVNPDDDARLFSFYPTLAGEIETTIRAKAGQAGLYMDGQPLVRFIVDDKLKHGKFDVIAEMVASAIVAQLRIEEMERYGLVPSARQARPQQAAAAPQRRMQAPEGYGNSASALEGNQQAPGWGNDQFDDEPAYDDPFDDDAYDDDLYYSGSFDEDLPEDDIDPFAPRTGIPAAASAAAGVAGGVGVAGAAAGVAGGVGVAGGGVGATKVAPVPQTNAAAPSQRRKQTQSVLIDDANGHTYVLSQSGMIAGRSKDCNIVVPDINTSRHHARFIRDASGRWAITDIGSKNGTLVNGGFIQDTTPLYDGDIITLGLTTYTYTVR